MKVISEDYLKKIGFSAIRRTCSDDLIDTALIGYINQARADLARLGVSEDITEDETDPLVQGCIEMYVAWRFEQDNTTAERMLGEYRILAEQLKRSQRRD